jgi:hypothetical protein
LGDFAALGLAVEPPSISSLCVVINSRKSHLVASQALTLLIEALDQMIIALHLRWRGE